MKRFLKDIFLFIAFSFIVMVMMFVVTDLRNRQLSYNIPKEKNILIMGHSMTENAINDDIFNRAKNLSIAGRPLVASCNYIQKIVDDNIHIDTVLLSVNVDFLLEPWTFLKREQIAISVICCGTFNNKFEQYSTPPEELFNILIQHWNWKNIKNLTTGQLDIPGCYGGLERDKLQVNLEIDRDKFPYKAHIDTTLYNYTKLLETKKFLDERDVHLILIDTPKYNPDDSIMEQQEFHALIKKFLPDFDYIDYVSFPLPIECYADIKHLKYTGAEIFSRYLQENGIGEY